VVSKRSDGHETIDRNSRRTSKQSDLEQQTKKAAKNAM